VVDAQERIQEEKKTKTDVLYPCLPPREELAKMEELDK